MSLEEADRVQTQPGTLSETSGGRPADLTRAHDQRPPCLTALELAVRMQYGEQSPHRDQRGQRREPEDGEIWTSRRSRKGFADSIASATSPTVVVGLQPWS
jgi:hypothetical protein